MVIFLSWNSSLAKHIDMIYTRKMLVELSIPQKSVSIIIKLQEKDWEGLYLKFSVDYRALEVVWRSKKQHPCLIRFDLPFVKNLKEISMEIQEKVFELKLKKAEEIRMSKKTMNSIKMPKLNKIIIPELLQADING